MENYTNKERIIIKQCNEGPFHTLVTKLSKEEFDNLASKLISDDDSYTLTSLIAIYIDYNRDAIIDYFIAKGDAELLIGFLDYCDDFSAPGNELNETDVVNKIIAKNDKALIKNILKSNNLYFLRSAEEKERLNAQITD